MKWQPSDERDPIRQALRPANPRRKLVQEYNIKDAISLTSCSVCHR